MRVITRAELAHRSTGDLAALYARVSDEVLNARYESPEWLSGMATLENIRREQAARNMRLRPPGGP